MCVFKHNVIIKDVAVINLLFVVNETFNKFIIAGTTQDVKYYYTLNGVLSLFGPYRWSLPVS